MKNEFVPYELAVKLKVLGFDEPCFGYWYTAQEEYKKIDIQLATIDFLEGEEDYILAPTFQQAFRWFRDNHNLYHTIDKQGYWFFEIKKDEGFGDLTEVIISYDYNSYEKAELACLDKLIEIVENK